uniref:C-type lectin domain-containing protein n=1 Tax=Panagrellus redivivus TaxID=6233 RepID=A0A7E4URY8_PANRE
MFRVLAALSAVAFTAASVIDSAELLPVPNEYKFHARPAHGISDPGSPWITGPKNNKYQFHIGRQSWLAAREHCLAQNSDLVVIQDAEELNWVLSHYAPALPHFIERLIQVGLYIDSHDGIREWHWTNHKSLNTSALAWISGEPFDHANGHERCAVLRVNAAALDDVDCDLPGSETKMYRFICQRSHEAHVKHEEVNNPLWKKLQDILDFFGISRPTGDNNSSENKTRPGEDEEDYWEMVKKENITDVDNTLNATETTIAAIKEVIESVEVLEGSGEEVTDSVPDGTSAPVQTHGAKTSENAVIADELLINDSLQKINSAEEAATTDAPATPLKKEEVIIETASVETTRTTKPDPLEKPTPKKSKDQIHYVDVLQKHMDKLEKIVNAVEHMIGPLTDDDSEEEGDLGEIAESKVSDTNSQEFERPVFGDFHPRYVVPVRQPRVYDYQQDSDANFDRGMLGMFHHLLTLNDMALFGAGR